MKKSIFLFGCFVFLSFLVGCSMMPSDDEILEWAIMENEILWDDFADESEQMDTLDEENLDEWNNEEKEENLDLDVNEAWEMDVQLELSN